ncbi:Lipoate-protein ligase A [Carpediemonas membranifera]|uniref:lipoate--protein ligase n=1 Tax=Carpediemonas membranifera TaxID=201153 RepID=A0A8J6B5Q2_9EUKA|nr:Lipoate-protein ligase A [Carpediemonas membranifera]|eukprot:KAG9393407.1 Lipoate-protein ligase A [Carpediemonas membranifera]
MPGNKAVHVLRSMSHNPFFNLATENWLLRSSSLVAKETLFLWQVKPTVIGVHQNPWAEVDVDAMKADDVFLARRQSGGGAVYQDMGNTNFTFVSDKNAFNKELNSEIVTKSLRRGYGIKAETSGRNDILVDGKKVSGAAYKLTPDRGFHHGTMMRDVEFASMGKYLTPHPLKLQSKGVASVQARVTNLNLENPSITHDGLCEALTDQFFETHGGSCGIEWIDEDVMKTVPEIEQEYRRLSAWSWRFGNTPKFSRVMDHKFDWGLVSMQFESTGGVVTGARMFSDCLVPSFVEAAEQALLGAELSLAGVAGFVGRLRATVPAEQHGWAEELGTWFGAAL